MDILKPSKRWYLNFNMPVAHELLNMIYIEDHWRLIPESVHANLSDEPTFSCIATDDPTK